MIVLIDIDAVMDWLDDYVRSNVIAWFIVVQGLCPQLRVTEDDIRRWLFGKGVPPKFYKAVACGLEKDFGVVVSGEILAAKSRDILPDVFREFPFQPRPGLMELLSSPDMRVAIVTNMFRPIATAKLESLRVLPYFEGPIIADDGDDLPQKPGSEPWERAVEALGGENEQVVLIEDSLKNLIGTLSKHQTWKAILMASESVRESQKQLDLHPGIRERIEVVSGFTELGLR